MPQCNFEITVDHDGKLSELAERLGVNRSVLVRIALDVVLPDVEVMAESGSLEQITASQLRASKERSIKASSAKRRS